MSIDTSLKAASTLAKHRNVLSRAEKVARLKDNGKFDPDKDSPLGLPKVGNRPLKAKKK